MMSTSQRGRGSIARRRLLGLLAVPLFVSQCAPTQCAPAPPPPTTTTTTSTTSTTTTTTVPDSCPPTPTNPSYSFLASCGELYSRWSRCENPISWQLDTTVPPTQVFRDELEAALVTIELATGHTFEQVLETSSTPQAGVEAVIGLRSFGGNTLGQGGGQVLLSTYEMISGEVYVSAAITDPALLRTTLLHELAHMLGLGHADDETQLMHQVVQYPYLQDYQDGDEAGLDLVGATQPCFAALRMASDDEPTREFIVTD